MGEVVRGEFDLISARRERKHVFWFCFQRKCNCRHQPLYLKELFCGFWLQVESGSGCVEGEQR